MCMCAWQIRKLLRRRPIVFGRGSGRGAQKARRYTRRAIGPRLNRGACSMRLRSRELAVLQDGAFCRAMHTDTRLNFQLVALLYELPKEETGGHTVHGMRLDTKSFQYGGSLCV